MEQQHRQRIGRSFAVAAKEVTVRQFGEFLKSRKESIEKYYNHEYSPTVDCPVNDVLWYDAAAYCNRLSRQEGITDPEQWCYLPNADGESAEGMRLAPDYLSRTGYRLPSEAEWEYACRAGAVTSRYYGETDELLGKYAWYTKNSQDRGMLPGVPGKLGVPGDCLKPNDLGLFDMLGNALEWCQEPIRYYSRGANGRPSEDIEEKEEIKDKKYRILRGGSFVYPALVVRSARRLGFVPTNRREYVGFRPARTFR
jgi:formylglycine-generating enzyme required for sulfatase activity